MTLEHIVKSEQDKIKSPMTSKEDKEKSRGRILSITRMIDRGYSPENIKLMMELEEKEMELESLEREHERMSSSPAYQELQKQIETLRTQAGNLEHYAKHMERVKKTASKEIDKAYAKEYAQQAAWYQEDQKRLQDWVMKTMLKHIEGGPTPVEQEVLRQEAEKRHRAQIRAGIPSLGPTPAQQGLTAAHLNPDLPDVGE